MPHLLIERLRAGPDFSDICCSIRRKRRLTVGIYFVEALEILAGVFFIWGSIDFLPYYAQDPNVLLNACILFTIGGVIYFAVSLFCLSESVDEKGWNSLETCENVLYVAGAFVFLVGTILYLPFELREPATWDSYDTVRKKNGIGLAVMLNQNSREFQGSVLFIIGSCMFAFAAYANALNMRQLHDIRSQMLTATTTAYMFGSMLFVMGSVAFLPDLGCNQTMESFGGWCFIGGSLQFELGGWISLARTVKEVRDEEALPLAPDDKDHV